ncbi:Transcriptional regulator WAR1 protein [Rutstroemia sp. NJR-2017a BBW]|nr:Transcriptional regulator WAR1 protein [Rutstroemia sp. NJR-2017a BBW]
MSRSELAETSSLIINPSRILNTLRAKVTAQPDLRIDILGILDTMGARFEAAKKEIAVAQGLDWENHTWDFAAEHSKLKKARVEKWCEIIAMAADEGRSPLTDVHDSVYEGVGEATSGYNWDNMQWESAMFDEILQDIHTGAVFKPVDWNTGMLADL